jgi:lipopolysaccharide transport system ATP-binding protein
MSTVIEVENLSKLYRLGEVSTGTLSHDLNRWWHKVRGKEDPYLKIGQVNDRTKTRKKAEKLKSDSGSASQASEISAFQNLSVSAFESDYVYALKDINFSVNQGEVLGIIGRNGAGKSTLLKILSRVTAPSSGHIKVKGRIASLLEVGTGFHPELTGRENIYLNGAILGMRRHEITNKLDEIVDFSGCAAYIDTPVKRFSSGMYVRLAFAVAANLDADTLIIDEVLAVGDLDFQLKCLGKLKDVAGNGRTVLFVSHNMSAVRRLCDQAFCLTNGGIKYQGLVQACIDFYTDSGEDTCLEKLFPAKSSIPCIRRVSINGDQAQKGNLDITIEYSAPNENFIPVPGIVIKTMEGDPVYGSNTRMHLPEKTFSGKAHGVLNLQCQNLPLMPGVYQLSVWLGEWHQNHDEKVDTLKFIFKGHDRHPHYPPSHVIGNIDYGSKWSLSQIS